MTDIGENKVQEIMDKYDAVKTCEMAYDRTSADKKVKYIIDKVDMIPFC